MRPKKNSLLFLVLAVVLVGCGGRGEAPRLVASYPAENQIAVYPPSSPDIFLVYHATITIEVANFQVAMSRLENLVHEYGGYVSSSQSWYQDGRPFGTVQLSVPAFYFDQVLEKLKSIGDLISEHVSGEVVQPYHGDETWRLYSQVTVHLRQKDSPFFSAALPDWRPLRTLHSAWGIFVSILGFFVDILIWVGVVVGPFLLMAWGVKRLLQRKKGKTTP